MLMSDEKYRVILEKDPTDTRAFVALCNSAKLYSDYQYLAELYAFRAQVIMDSKEIADLFFKAGSIYADKLDKLPDAVIAFLRGFEADKTHAGIGDRLDAIYRYAADWESVLLIAEQRVEALDLADRSGEKTAIRSDLHRQVGEIWKTVYGDKIKALGHYERSIDLDKTNIRALYGAREFCYSAGEFKNAAKLCELEARAEQKPERRSALYRELASIYETKLTETDKAVTALKRALEATPQNLEIKDELARLIPITSLTGDTAKDHQWATDYLVRKAGDSNERESINLLARAIISTPTDERALAAVESATKRKGNTQVLADAYTSIISRLPSAEHKAPIIRRLVSIYRV